MRLGLPCMLLLGTLVACAPTIGPVSLPAEVMVVLDQKEKTLIIIPVDSTNVADTIKLQVVGNGSASPITLAVHGSTAAVGYDDSTTVVIVNLATGHNGALILVNPGTSPSRSPITSVGFGEDGIGYAAIPLSNAVATFFPSISGATSPAPYPGGPQGFAVARGTVFVIAGSRQTCIPVLPVCANTSSFLVPINSPSTAYPLSGPGNASTAVFAPDGFLYVLNTGNGGTVEGRLSQFDPVQLTEVNLFGGLGPLPKYLASDGGDRLFIVSDSAGIMVFNTATRSLVRGPTNGIPLTRPRGIATDALGRVYALEAGGCVAGQQGQIRAFGTDLVEVRRIPTGICPVAIAVTEIPSDIFHLNN